jgi:hypothetical protein
MLIVGVLPWRLAPALAAHLDGPDSLRVRLEIGASADYTNELFYEDTFDSTAYTGRHLVDSPETRYSGVLFTSLAGTRGRRATSFQLQNELGYGDLLQRDLLGLALRCDPSALWTLYSTPHFEYRHDRTFGRDLEEWRGSAGVRARRAFADGSTFGEFGARGDFIRSSGRGSEFILDRQTANASVALEQAPLLGLEWRLGYGFTTRAFPDSTVRNQFEHGLDGRLRLDLPGGHPLVFEGAADRRLTVDPAPTSRDNFWEERGAVDAEFGLSEAWSLRARFEGEAIQYDLEDSTLFFDYQVIRGRAGPRLALGSLGVTLGPRAEVLISRLNPAEGYQEIGGGMEVEVLARGAWWSIAPAAGWRDYDELPAASQDGIGLHSSYAFYELGILGDQAIPGALRLRVFANARYESHVDAAQDARSLYFSLDVRRLF